MSDSIGTSNRIRGMSRLPSMRSMNGVFAAWSKYSGALALCPLLLSGLIGVAQEQQPSQASQDFQQVEVLIQQNRLHEAKTKALEELQHHSASVEGYNLLGIIETDQQNYSSAIAAFQKALQLRPNSTKTHNNLGNVYVAQRRLDLAEREFRTAVRFEPGNNEGNYNLGVLLMIKGSPAQAIPHLERVHPMNAATGMNLIRAYLQTMRAADALRVASELSAQNKDDVKIHFSLGVMLASEKQFKAAQLELEKADALQTETFEILYNLGQDLLRMQNYPKAEVTLSRALRLKPESADTLHLLAEVYTNESRPLDALDLLLRAHKIAPENTDIILLMAKISMSQEYYEDAIPLLESGVQIAPQRADVRAALGQSYFMSGRIDKALDEFKKLISIEPSARSYAFVALAYRNLGRFDDAEQYVLKGLKLDPNNNTCLLNLGFIAEAQGDRVAAEAAFEKILRTDPDFPDALLELANLRVASKDYVAAAGLLKNFIRVGHNPAAGYYKLAMVERNLHQMAAADQDLRSFQALSKNASTGPLPFQNLFGYLDTRSKLDAGSRGNLDIADLTEQIKKHPDNTEDLYFLVEAYLKSGKLDEASATIEQLDKLSAGDYKTLTGVGVLLARYHLYDKAIKHFQAALQANPGSDEVKFDLANAYFIKRQYSQALDTAGQVSEEGRKDDGYLTLLGDIYAHLGDAARAADIFRGAILRNPDNDENYLALALLDFRNNNVAEARQTLVKGLGRVPGSGKILWGLGLASVLDGNSAQAAAQLESAVDLLPEWAGSYSVLGVFYYQMGQIDKAREVLNRFRNSNASASLDANRIEQFLAQAPAPSAAGNEPMSMANRAQLLQLALSLADRTL
jgi:tetratricopeptide (TPR) repeat protein